MKIKKLEILNLASLDKEGGETINFDEGALRDSNIFSIVGPTGSGKSTILDAICLALYNRAPRYPLQRNERQKIEIYGRPDESENNRLAPTDGRNILTRGKKKGYTKLTFLANNGVTYRAEWWVSMGTKNYRRAETYLYKITRKNGEVLEEVEEWNRLPMIIGLDYDQFLRTVLIAQGSFSSFIKAKENERYELLEKLIGCEELYSKIAAKIKTRKEEAVNEFTEIAANFSARESDILQEDELIQVRNRIEELENIEKALKEELNKTNESISWYSTEKRHLENISNYEIAFNSVSLKMEETKESASRLELHDATLQAVSFFKDKKSAEGKISELNNEIKNLGDKLIKKEDLIKTEEFNLTRLKQVAQKTVDELAIQLPHIRKAREINTELNGLRKILDEKKETKESIVKAKTKAEEDIEENKSLITKTEISLEKENKNLTDLQKEISQKEEVLSKKLELAKTNYINESAKAEGNDLISLQNARNNAERTLSDLRSAIKIQKDLAIKLNEKERNLAQENQFTEENKKIEEKLATFDIENLKKNLETLEKSYLRLTNKDFAILRSELMEGEKCPLCGSTHHPFPKDNTFDPLVEEMKKLIENETENLNNKQKEKENLILKRAANLGKLDGVKKILQNLEDEIIYLTKEWENIKSLHENWPADEKSLSDLSPKFEDEFKSANDKLSEYNELLKNIDKLRKEKENIEEEKHKFEKSSSDRIKDAEKKINIINTQLETEKGKTKNLVEQLNEKNNALTDAVKAFEKASDEVNSKILNLKDEIGDSDPDKLEKELTDAQKNANEDVTKKIEFISLLREELKELKGQESAKNSQRESEQKTLNEKQIELTNWLTVYNEGKSEILTEENISDLFESKDNWEEIRDNINRIKREFTSAETTLKNEQKILKEHQEKKPEINEEELLKRKAELENHSNAELIETKARLQRHEKAQVELGSMLSKKQEAELYKREWEQIMSAIGPDGKILRKITQCYTLGFLIEHANAEIRKFNSRYELQQVKNSLGIRVIDHDRADDVRDTTSLSGGETFIVSLGLALGLSALSSRNISFDNLFIDEGFGTLDPDTLDTVIDSLSVLQTSQGKKVGVISHTDSMSERITTQIRVIKHGNSGSSHIEVYP